MIYALSLFLLKTAIASLNRHKGRSFLTVMSIIIGIATVIATLAIGRGAQEKIRSRLANMGTNSLSLYAGTIGGSITNRRTPPLTTYDVSFLRSFDPRIRRISGVYRCNEIPVMYQNKKSSAPITGAEPDALAIGARTLRQGRNFVSADLHAYATVAILGSDIAQSLFGCSDPLGKVIIIGEKQYTVIGVLNHKERHDSVHNSNQEIYLPLTSCRHLVGKHNNIVKTIIMSIDEQADITQVERLLGRAMRARHQLATSDPDDFTILNQASMMAAAEQSSQTFSLFLLIIASLSLFVGGLGVSNIMLVTVAERTREIGIRMALGASPTMILTQFLMESTFLCLIGGIIGTILGILAPYLISFFTKWHVVVSFNSIIISVLITSLIGLFFGFWPGYRASRLTIVDALNDQ